MSKHVSISKKIAAAITTSLMLGSFVPAQAGPIDFIKKKAKCINKFLNSKTVNNINSTLGCIIGAACIYKSISLSMQEYNQFIRWINTKLPKNEYELMSLKYYLFSVGLVYSIRYAPQLMYNTYQYLQKNTTDIYKLAPWAYIQSNNNNL